jgi:type II secretory pathway pseudopilin PulG
MMSTLFRDKRSGMTLVEAVVAISIYVVLLMAITTSVTSLYRTNSYALEQSGEIDNVRRAMVEWNRDVKELITAENGTYPIAIMGEHIFGYYSDTDLDDSVEYIEYILATTTLRKYTYNPSGSPAVYDFSAPDQIEILSEHVRNIEQATTTFYYYDNFGGALASTSPLVDMRYVKAQFIVNIDPVRNPGEFMLRSSLAPRNLKDNL